MKKNLVFLLVFFTVSFAKAQPDFSDLRFDIGANYTMYKGDFQEKTPGAKIRVAVPFTEKVVVGLGFTYGFPIKTPSAVSLSGGGTADSEIKFNFKTITLEGDYYFGEEKEEGVSVYASARAGLVLVSYKETVKGTIPSGQEATDLIEKTSQTGFTLNGALGLQYALGNIKIFGDAGIALPANQVNGQYVSNPIPSHFMFNAGVRIGLGSSDY
jgi:opacity protein-like surface antigen